LGIQIQEKENTYQGVTKKEKHAKISTTVFDVGERFKFTAMDLKTSFESKYKDIKGNKKMTNLYRINYKGDEILTFQTENSAFDKVCKANMGKEITIEKVMKNTKTGSPYYTFVVVEGDSPSPSLSLKKPNPTMDYNKIIYNDGQKDWSIKSIVDFIKSEGEFDNKGIFVSTLSDYGLSKQEAEQCFEKRSSI